MEARRFRVWGRVQGVGFRAFVWREAKALGLTGWVCNRFDGSVEAVAAGSAARLEEFAERLGQGSRFSRVDRVESHEEPDAAEFTEFSVGRSR